MYKKGAYAIYTASFKWWLQYLLCRGSEARKTFRAVLFSQVSSAEGNQFIGDLEEERILDREDGDDMKFVE